MNRRSFIAAGTSLIALARQRAYAQSTTIPITSYESSTTGAIVDTSASNLSVVEFATDNGTETVTLGSETAYVSIGFPPAGAEAASFLEEKQAAVVDSFTTAEPAGGETLADGGWFAASVLADNGVQHNIYYELQTGAFPEHDLIVMLVATVDTFADDFEELQKVTIADIEPLLFVEDSKIATLAFPQVAAATTTTRTTRSSGNTTETKKETPATTRQSRTAATGGDTSGYVTAVTEHHATFVGEFATFITGLGVVTDTASTDADKSTAIESMVAAAQTWPRCANDAALLDAPAGMETLEESYLYWAGCVTDLGLTWEGMIAGVATAEALLASLDTVVAADEALVAELDAAGA